MEPENPIYLKLDYNESINSKRDILSLEVSLLKLIKLRKTYHLFKEEEFQIKLKICAELKELEKNVNKVSSSLPKLKLSEKIKSKNKEIKEKMEKEASETNSELQELEKPDDLEVQLSEINEKLKEIENMN